MRSISTGDLADKSYFDAPVYLDDGFILTSPDVQVSGDLLERLKKWGYGSVQTAGSPVDAPSNQATGGGDSAATNLELSIQERQKIDDARSFYDEFYDFSAAFYEAFAEHGALSIGNLTEMLKKAIEVVKSNKSVVLRFNEFDRPADNYVIPYSVKTTLLCLAIGEFNKTPPHKLIEIGVSAFLHDIGMIKIPHDIYLTNRILTDQEKKTMMAHTIIGYKILRAQSVADDVALGALEHHERMDGSGYPRRLSGAKISDYPRIIAVADAYVASTSKRQYKTPKDGHQALKDIFARKQHDPNVVKSLIYILSIFPLGTYVLLSGGARGIVVRTNPESPKLPLVQILQQPNEDSAAGGPVIQTADESGLTVERSLTAQEVRELKATLGNGD